MQSTTFAALATMAMAAGRAWRPPSRQHIPVTMMADEIPLAMITPVKVEDWRTNYVEAHRGDNLAEQRATRSPNSYLRNARALFSRRVLDAMKKTWRETP